MAMTWFRFVCLAALLLILMIFLLVIRKKARRDDAIVRDCVAKFKEIKSNYSDKP
jgi:hypothetical protein